MQKGLLFLQPIIDALTAATQFQPVVLADEEKRLTLALPKALNAGEKEAIAICLNRAGNKFLTNDKRANNFCLVNSIISFDLNSILRQLWKGGHCTKDEVKSLIDEIEKSEPGMVIKSKDGILR